jgi:hypothetical protein
MLAWRDNQSGGSASVWVERMTNMTWWMLWFVGGYLVGVLSIVMVVAILLRGGSEVEDETK